VSIPGGVELRARVLPGLRGGGRVIVDAGPDRHTLARSMLAPRRFRTAYWHGLLPLAVHQHWAGVLVGPDTVSVLVLFAPTADENQRVKVLAAMTDELPAALARLQGSTVGPASREPGARSRRQEPVRTPDSAPTDGDDWFGDARTPTSGHD
jgi:hypothetical protein